MKIFKKEEETVDPKKETIEAFFNAVKQNDIDWAQKLLLEHPDLNLTQTKNWDFITCLDKEYTPKNSQYTPLEVCLTKNNNLDMLAFLLDNKVQITETALLITANRYRGYTSSVFSGASIDHIEMLTLFGADWNFKVKDITCAQTIFLKACDNAFGEDDKMKLYQLGACVEVSTSVVNCITDMKSHAKQTGNDNNYGSSLEHDTCIRRRSNMDQ